MSDVRVLEPQDAPALIELRREALDAHPLVFGASPEDDRGLALEFVRGALDPGARERNAVFGLYDRGALAGMAGVVRATQLKRRHSGHIWGMYVTPRARGRGGGRALLEAAIAHACAWAGMSVLSISVTTAAPQALGLYLDAGFRVWGREPRALSVDGTVVDEIHLTMSLDGS